MVSRPVVDDSVPPCAAAQQRDLPVDRFDDAHPQASAEAIDDLLFMEGEPGRDLRERRVSLGSDRAPSALELARAAVGDALPVEEPHVGRGVHAHGIVEAEQPQPRTKLLRATICSVREDRAARQAAVQCTSNHLQRQLGLGREGNADWDPHLLAALAIRGPRLGQVQLEVDRHVVGAGRQSEAHPDLAVGNLPCRAGVLPLHADRVRPLLEEAGVVDNPSLELVPRDQRRQRVANSLRSDIGVAPFRDTHEVEEPLVGRVGALRERIGSGRDRLRALALGIGQDPHRIRREGRSALLEFQHVADAPEVGLEPLHCPGVHELHDPCTDHPRIPSATGKSVLRSKRSISGSFSVKRMPTQ